MKIFHGEALNFIIDNNLFFSFYREGKFDEFESRKFRKEKKSISFEIYRNLLNEFNEWFLLDILIS